jgi:hypothetical protein
LKVHKRHVSWILTPFLSKASPDAVDPIVVESLLYNFMLVYVLYTYILEFDGIVAALAYPCLPCSYVLSLDVLCLVLQ